MADLPPAGRRDLDSLIFGGSRFLPQSGDRNSDATEAPLPNRALDHRESAEAPAPSKDSHDPLFEMYFDYRQYERDTTDTASQSEPSSEETSGTSPPGLTTGSSVGSGADPDDDVVMLDAPPSPELNKRILWPSLPDADLPRNPIIHDHIDLAQYGEGLPSAMALPQALHAKPLPQPHAPDAAGHSSAGAGKKKTRIVPEPQKTSKVREKGACTLCRVSRVSCDVDASCSKCTKLCGDRTDIDIKKVCGRGTFFEAVGALAKRWCQNGILAPKTSQFFGDRKTVFVSLSPDPQSPRLPVTARCFNMGSQKGVGVVPEEIGHDEISRWAKRSFLAGSGSKFEALTRTLLAAYVDERALSHARSLEAVQRDADAVLSSLQTCLKKLLRMREMWNVWRCATFYIHQPGNARGQPLPDSHRAIQGYFHQYAGEEISQLEKEVLKEIDKLFAQNGIKKDSPLLLSAYYVGMWVALWQLALMYRHSQPRNTPFSDPITEDLFNKVVVLYSGLFRTSKAFKCLKDAGSKVFRDRPVVRRAFEEAWKAHTEFYQSFERQYPGDELIEALVIRKESKVLSRKQPARRQ